MARPPQLIDPLFTYLYPAAALDVEKYFTGQRRFLLDQPLSECPRFAVILPGVANEKP
jgi:hypothetical protein